MNKPRKHSLDIFVHRTLIVRLSIAGLTVSLLLGIAVFFYQRDKVSERVIAFAHQRAKLFNARFIHLFDAPGLLNHEEIQHELENFRSDREQSELGNIVFSRFYNSELNAVAEVMDSDYPGIEEIEKVIEFSERLLPRHSADEWHEVLRIKGTPHLRVIIPLINSEGVVVGIAEGVFAPSLKTIQGVLQAAVFTMLTVIAIVLLTAILLYPVILNLTNKLSAFSVRLLDANLETLEILGNAIALKDSDTNAHNYRVTIISVRIAEAADLSADSIRTLIKGAFLHDVGKIGITDNILLKPARLTEDEFEVMKTHVSQGQELVSRSTWLRDTLKVVGFHHEKVNGKGYPKGIKAEDIPITARIFAIADVFDALTSKRPYKEPFPFDETMRILEEGRDIHFDPDMLDMFTYIAKPLYDRLSGRDEVPRDEMKEIIRKYFTEGIDNLDY
jgi:HD-GYP domain-containing protein (c-di-GMP phosphodiesterase class II)